MGNPKGQLIVPAGPINPYPLWVTHGYQPYIAFLSQKNFIIITKILNIIINYISHPEAPPPHPIQLCSGLAIGV
jgi:hypothetical protein